MNNPFASRRIRDLPPPDEPSTFAVVGGWAEAHDAAAAGRLDPINSEREQRASGALALAELERSEAKRRQQVMDERLRGVRRGHDYRRPI